MSTKVYEYFSLLPAELRMMMIDEMEPADRCRFTRCSHSCYKETKRSKKYLEGLELTANGEKAWSVDVIYSQVKGLPQHGYRLETVETSEIKYSSLQTKEELWRIEVNNSTEAIEYVFEVFAKHLDVHQIKIKHLQIRDSSNYPFSETVLKNYDFGIKKLKNLEYLNLSGFNLKQFLPKIQKPLKSLHLPEETNNEVLQYFEQISQVQEELFIPSLKLSNSQFLQLAARKMKLHIGQLTEMDIYNFVTSWKNGEIRDNYEKCEWALDDDSSFDVKKLCRMLGEDLQLDDDFDL